MTDWLCTLAQAKSEIKALNGDSADDQWIINNIPLVSTRLNILARTRFIPWVELYYYDAFGAFIDDVYRKLDLGRPLLEPIQVIDALNNSLTEGVDYVLRPQDSPAYQLQRINTIYGWSYGVGYGVYFWIAPIQWENAIKVTAVWGYRNNYPSEGWTDSQQLLTTVGGINASVRTFDVTNVNGLDINAYSPAISVGNYLKIGEEMLGPVVAISGTQTVTVAARGANGFTAAAHDEDDVVYTWSVQPEVVRAAVRWLGYWYTRRGAFEATKNDLAQGHTLVYPADVPAEIMHIIDQTRDWRWAAV